jgi:hypothetical protein
VAMPTLYYVPMTHTLQELGSFRDAVLAVRTRIFGEKATIEFFEQAEKHWETVEQRIRQSGLYRSERASKLHIFVDSLPDAEPWVVAKVVEELIKSEMPVYLIIRDLLKNGAKIHGTENREILLEDHRYWTGISKGEAPDDKKAQELLRNRDVYVAERIISVVSDEMLALLFMGRGHDVVGELTRLSKNFTIINL